MFYDIYSDLCKQIGKSPSAVAQELVINKSNVTNWKNNGYTPRGNVLNRIAEYFNVSVDYLLGHSEVKEKTANDVAADFYRIERARIADSNAKADSDIRRIERARKRMNETQKEEMMKILEISFKQFFSDDFEDDDIDE